MNVVFVVPYAMETTLRFARATAGIPGVRLGVISQEPGDVLMRELDGKLAAFERVKDPLNPDELTRAVRTIGGHFGGKVERQAEPLASSCFDAIVTSRLAEDVLRDSEEPRERRAAVLVAEPISAQPRLREGFGGKVAGSPLESDDGGGRRPRPRRLSRTATTRGFARPA